MLTSSLQTHSLTPSLIDTGFAVLKNHPIAPEFIEAIYNQWQNFFESDKKFNYDHDKTNLDGYFPFRSENAAGYDKKNLSEFFNVYPWGQYPTEVSKQAMELHTKLMQLAGTLLTWAEKHITETIKQQLSMPLDQMIVDGHRNLMRIIYYPALDGKEEPGSVRSYEHEDINLITLLPAATSKGLQVKDSQGQWFDVPVMPGNIIVNVGDMLQLCTNQYYKSTTHRVINPEGELAEQSRMSIPLFVHPQDDVMLSATKNAKQYWHERMTENGLVK